MCPLDSENCVTGMWGRGGDGRRHSEITSGCILLGLMNYFTQRKARKEFGEKECYDLIYVLTPKPRAVCRGLLAETGRPARRLLQ